MVCKKEIIKENADTHKAKKTTPALFSLLKSVILKTVAATNWQSCHLLTMHPCLSP